MIVKAGAAPAWNLASGIVILAVAQAAEGNGAHGKPPGCVADDDLPGAVFQIKLDLEKQLHIVAPRSVVKIPDDICKAIIPAVPQDYPHRVFALPQLFCDIVSLIVHCFFIIGESGIQEEIPYLLAVELQLIIAQPANVRPGAAYFPVYPEVLAEHRRGKAARFLAVGVEKL